MFEIETRHCIARPYRVVFGMGFSLARCGKETFHAVSVVGWMGMVTCSGSVRTPLWFLSVAAPSFIASLTWTRLVGPGVCSGMGGYQLCLVALLEIRGLLTQLVLLPTVWKRLLGPMLVLVRV